MLIITRRTDSREAFWVGNNIRIRLAPAGSANQVRVLIEAPDDVKILREELTDSPEPDRDRQS